MCAYVCVCVWWVRENDLVCECWWFRCVRVNLRHVSEIKRQQGVRLQWRTKLGKVSFQSWVVIITHAFLHGFIAFHTCWRDFRRKLRCFVALWGTAFRSIIKMQQEVRSTMSVCVFHTVLLYALPAKSNCICTAPIQLWFHKTEHTDSSNRNSTFTAATETQTTSGVH